MHSNNDVWIGIIQKGLSIFPTGVSSLVLVVARARYTDYLSGESELDQETIDSIFGTWAEQDSARYGEQQAELELEVEAEEVREYLVTLT